MSGAPGWRVAVRPMLTRSHSAGSATLKLFAVNSLGQAFSEAGQTFWGWPLVSPPTRPPRARAKGAEVGETSVPGKLAR